MVITSTIGNRVAANTARGFESLLLRQKETAPNGAVFFFANFVVDLNKSIIGSGLAYTAPKRSGRYAKENEIPKFKKTGNGWKKGKETIAAACVMLESISDCVFWKRKFTRGSAAAHSDNCRF